MFFKSRPSQATSGNCSELPCQGWGRGFESLRPLQIACSISRVSGWLGPYRPSLSRYIASSIPSGDRKPGDERRALVRGDVASGCLPLSLAFASEAAFASGDFIEVRLSLNGGQSTDCCDNPCSTARARPKLARPGCRNLDTAILLERVLTGARCLTGKAGRMQQGACFSLFQNLLSRSACPFSADTVEKAVKYSL
jgi:hypothetical protein